MSGSSADIEAGRKICKWIADNNVSKPEPLTVDILGLEAFDECVWVYKTAHGFGLRREHRGNNIRDEIYDYIKQSALRFDEFAMIVEQLDFDTGIVKTAKHMIMYREVQGGVHRAPEINKIMDYCKHVGIWEEMLAIKKEIESKREADKYH